MTEILFDGSLSDWRTFAPGPSIRDRLIGEFRLLRSLQVARKDCPFFKRG